MKFFFLIGSLNFIRRASLTTKMLCFLFINKFLLSVCRLISGEFNISININIDSLLILFFLLSLLLSTNNKTLNCNSLGNFKKNFLGKLKIFIQSKIESNENINVINIYHKEKNRILSC